MISICRHQTIRNECLSHCISKLYKKHIDSTERVYCPFRTTAEARVYCKSYNR